MGMVIHLIRRLSWVALLIWAGACASASASSTPLVVPAPPPREVPVPVALPEVAEAEPPAQSPAAARETSPRPRRPATPSPPASAASPATPSAAAPPAQVTTSPPPADLRATGSGMQAISADEVRRMIDRAGRTLEGVDRRRLSSAGQVQHDTARRFLTQAEAAVKTDHLIFAKYLAEKGEALANGLR